MAHVVVSTTSTSFGQLPSELSELVDLAASIVPTATTLYQLENGIAYDVGVAFYSLISEVSANQIVSESASGSSLTVQTPTWTATLYGSISAYGSYVSKWVMSDSHGDSLSLIGGLSYSGLPVVSPLISGSHIDNVAWSIPSPNNANDSLIGTINTAAAYSGASSFNGTVSSFTAGLVDSLDQRAYVVTYATSQSISIPVDGLGVSVSDGTLSAYSIGITDHTGAETDYAYVGGIALDLAATSPQQNLIQDSLAGNDVVSISGPGALDILAVLPAEDASATSFTIEDSAANVQANLGALEALATQGKLASIALTDPATPTISLTATQQTADAHALARITTPYDLATVATVPCYAAGTRIETEHGAAPVEHLREGDTIRLATGGTARIVWLGHRRVDCRRHPRPADVWPVRVLAHAFGLGRPVRDVLLSPDHAVFVEDVLIPVRYLLNGATLRQERVAVLTYWHVELEHHGVLLAEGLPAESYLDTGNRASFANGGKAVAMHADFARASRVARGCAPLATEGAMRDRVYRRLIVQALALGWRVQDAGDGRVRWLRPRTASRVALARAGASPSIRSPTTMPHPAGEFAAAASCQRTSWCRRSGLN